MEINLFKHHYFVIVSYRPWMIDEKKAYMFIQCRAKDIRKTILSKMPDEAKLTGIETITKLD